VSCAVQACAAAGACSAGCLVASAAAPEAEASACDPFVLASSNSSSSSGTSSKRSQFLAFPRPRTTSRASPRGVAVVKVNAERFYPARPPARPPAVTPAPAPAPAPENHSLYMYMARQHDLFFPGTVRSRTLGGSLVGMPSDSEILPVHPSPGTDVTYAAAI
jgi:hypothetical protein